MWSSKEWTPLNQKVKLFPDHIRFLNMLLDITYGFMPKGFEYRLHYNNMNTTLFFCQIYTTGNDYYYSCLRPVEFWDLAESVEVPQPMRVLIPITTMPEELI
jgi:hypothetical protein